MANIKLNSSSKQVNLTIRQGRPTFGPRFEWPAQYFLKPCVPSILEKVEDRFDVKAFFSCFFFQVLVITMISGQKVGNLRVISGEEDFFHFIFLFFRDHYDFGAKSGVFCLFGPPIFSINQNGPRLKKVKHPCFKVSTLDR